MTHDEPFFMAPDDKHDLISGTCSHLPFVKARYKGLLKNDNQLAMLSVSGGPNDTSVGEISLKTGDNALNGEETV